MYITPLNYLFRLFLSLSKEAHSITITHNIVKYNLALSTLIIVYIKKIKTRFQEYLDTTVQWQMKRSLLGITHNMSAMRKP